MLFADDTECALIGAAALVNTVQDGVDQLDDISGLDAWLRDNPMSGVIRRTKAELADVRALRTKVRELWSVRERDQAARLVNEMLVDAEARPYLSKHDALDWHLHVSEPDAPLSARIGGEIAMAVLDLIRTNTLARLKICAAEDCDDVLVDLSKNQSKRYCTTANCGNRTNVAAYRARKRARPN